MQVNVICNYCGAESFSEARFCRQCGRLLEERQPASVTEGTTRLLDSPPKAKTTDPFANMNEWAPINKVGTNPISIPTGKETQILTTQKQKSYVGWFIGGGIAFVGVAVLAFALLFVFWFTPVVPPAPPVPPATQIPPAPPASAPNTTAFEGLIYPGATTTLSVNGDNGKGNVLQLQTKDSFDKVVAWYMDKLKPTKTVSVPGAPRILISDETKAIIRQSGDDTVILLAQEGE